MSSLTGEALDRAFPAHDPRRARTRLLVSAIVGAVTIYSLDRFGWAVRVVAGWNGFSLTQLGLAWWIIAGANAAETRRRAAAEDPGRAAASVIVILSSVVSLFVAGYLLRRARSLAPEASGALVVLCLTAVVCSWLLTHTTYTLRYARLYYRHGGHGGSGLGFPGEHPPDDWDFAYFAFTIGMCFQVSDVVISSRLIRRLALRHAMISFAYNTAILALALNLVFGLFG